MLTILFIKEQYLFLHLLLHEGPYFLL